MTRRFIWEAVYLYDGLVYHSCLTGWEICRMIGEYTRLTRDMDLGYRARRSGYWKVRKALHGERFSFLLGST